MTEHDLIVIGAGPGGYVCAIRAAQHGLKVACIDERETLGGTCLNVGCIPSKALLHASAAWASAREGRHGLRLADPVPDLAAIMEEKVAAVGRLTGGIDALFRKNGVTRLTGRARFEGPDRVSVEGESHRAPNIVIATGSSPATLRGAEVDNSGGVIVDSTGALSFERVPRRMVVIGGGVIGLELGSVWARLGAEVTVLEYRDRILPEMDADVSAEMAKLLGRQGLSIRPSMAVGRVSRQGEGAEVQIAPAEGGPEETLQADVVLVATGRRANLGDLGLEAVGLQPEDQRLTVDAYMRTSVSGLRAIGDATPGPMLAHRAEDEGIAVADWLAGLENPLRHDLIPSVVYTSPEAAGVGLTEAAARATGAAIEVGRFPMAGNSRAVTNGEARGFVKVVAEADDGRVLGVHIVAEQAGTMIAQAVQAMELGATAEDIAYTCHAHPTHSEALKEAAMSIGGRPIHV